MAVRIFLWIGFLFALFPLFAQQNAPSGAYGLIASTVPAGSTNKDSVLHFFKMADTYMDLDRYDSAELWLSKVGDRLEYKKAGIFNYYYHSRQSEVFYYNNLLQIGLQQANRALQIALELKDSLFIADAHNFLGLFYLNLEKFSDAAENLKTGLLFCQAKKTDGYHLVLSEPHHLHGNLGETYLKMGAYKKALLHFDSSIRQAQGRKAPRAEALGYISAGEALMALQQYDSAFYCMTTGKQLAIENRDNDVALLGFGNLASLYAITGSRSAAYYVATEGLAFQQSQPGLNPLYTLLFMRRLVDMYNIFHDYKNVASMQREIMDIEEAVRRKSNLQMESVLSAGLTNENKLLQLEVEEARQKQEKSNLRMAFLLVITALMLLATLYYRNRIKQKLALVEMREKISQNLHDDIGATISSLHIYSSLAQSTLNDKTGKASELLQRISDQSKILMENMNDMVWSMRTDAEDAMTLSTRIKNFGAELLNAKNIQCKYNMDEDVFRCFSNYEARKNILLILKEGINNTAKYSEATHAHIALQRNGKEMLIEIADNGIGFDTLRTARGNGLRNMASRAKAMNGTCQVTSSPGEGTKLLFRIPIP